MRKFRHPELLEGEVLLGNYSELEFSELSHRTKRMGKVAYTKNGKEIVNPWVNPEILLIEAVQHRFVKFPHHSHFFPVFVQRSELEKAGVDLKRFE